MKVEQAIVQDTVEEIELQFDETYQVSKANELIELTRYLGLLEHKFIGVLASNIQPDDPDFQTYTFSIKKFGELLGTKTHNHYEALEEMTNRLMKPFVIQEGPYIATKIAWLSRASYHSKQGKISVRFDPALKPFFLALGEQYTGYRLKNIIQLNSVYSIRLYELLKRYKTIRKRTFAIDDLKKKLGCENKYQEFVNFRRRVLLHCQKELAEKTDIAFDFEPIRSGRKVTDIVFKIKDNTPKDNKVKINVVDEIVELSTVDNLINLGFENGLNLKESIVEDWVRTYGFLRVEQAIKRYEGKKTSPDEYTPILEEMMRDAELNGEGTAEQWVEQKLIELNLKKVIIDKIIEEYGLEQVQRNIEYTLERIKAGRVKNHTAYVRRAIKEDYAIKKKTKPKKESVKKKTTNQPSVDVEELEFLKSLIKRYKFQENITDNTLVRWLKTYKPEDIDQAVVYTHKNRDGVNNPGAYIESLLQKGFDLFAAAQPKKPVRKEMLPNYKKVEQPSEVKSKIYDFIKEADYYEKRKAERGDSNEFDEQKELELFKKAIAHLNLPEKEFEEEWHKTVKTAIKMKTIN